MDKLAVSCTLSGIEITANHPMQVDIHNVSGLRACSRQEMLGWIVRQSAPFDGGSKWLILSRKGKQVIKNTSVI